jgi:hypothetical protein
MGTMEWATDGTDGSFEEMISKTLFCSPEFLINVFDESILAIRARLL